MNMKKKIRVGKVDIPAWKVDKVVGLLTKSKKSFGDIARIALVDMLAVSNINNGDVDGFSMPTELPLRPYASYLRKALSKTTLAGAIGLLVDNRYTQPDISRIIGISAGTVRKINNGTHYGAYELCEEWKIDVKPSIRKKVLSSTTCSTSVADMKEIYNKVIDFYKDKPNAAKEIFEVMSTGKLPWQEEPKPAPRYKAIVPKDDVRDITPKTSREIKIVEKVVKQDPKEILMGVLGNAVEDRQKTVGLQTTDVVLALFEKMYPKCIISDRAVNMYVDLCDNVPSSDGRPHLSVYRMLHKYCEEIRSIDFEELVSPNVLALFDLVMKVKVLKLNR